ncbi:MAG: NADH dehydrogenase [Candidatus Saccharibacteria bacterium GW2011_GWA2_46_10]|nr:MAG: NADH dehydrogenase [Candidatus Saccharibacteria bacterium GW2011_GWA2_46_10]OGL35006.1 MAG: hypothetical protein A3F05_01580 [Candidatus Saccharibacteria bacterium RIFCSPHIGHO2_12_FULL_47_17]
MVNKRKILIAGGGFGGIKAALELESDENSDITLLSDHDYFRYYPALYRAATGGRSAASSIPLAEIFDGKNVKLVIDEAQKIDKDQKLVRCHSGKGFYYDTLIIALGVVTNYYGIKGLAEYSYGIKTLEEAQRLRDHLHKLIADEGKPDLNYIIIGGGPTGVELAGALPAYLRHVMASHGLAPKKFHIDLIEAMPRLLPAMPAAYSKAVTKQLRQLGIKLYLDHKVQAENTDSLTVSGHDIKSHTVVWTAGVTNHPFFKNNDFALSPQGKVMVDANLMSESNIYVIGDNAQTPYSGLAQTALYDAVFVASNLKRLADGGLPQSYKPKQPIYVTPVGPHWAAVLWGKSQIYGFVGWLLRKAADFAGYRDYEPWWRASEHWLAANQSEETCPICAKH